MHMYLTKAVEIPSAASALFHPGKQVRLVVFALGRGDVPPLLDELGSDLRLSEDIRTKKVSMQVNPSSTIAEDTLDAIQRRFGPITAPGVYAVIPGAVGALKMVRDSGPRPADGSEHCHWVRG